jgi:hypothetical protein
MHPVPIQEVYFYSKLVGAIGTAVGTLYGIIRWLRAGYKEVKITNENIATLMSNHIPHLQSTLDAHGDSLQVIKSDVRILDTKFAGMESNLETTRGAVHTLGTSFLQHLENASKEKSVSKKRSRRS